MKRMFEGCLGAAALALAALPFAAGSAQAEDPIALGWVGPLSPPGNYSGGQEMQWAVQLGVDEVNKAGGVLGRQINVTYEDTKGQPAEGSAAAVRLITKDNVAAIFGEFHSSVALAEIEEAHKYGVAWVGTDVWSDAITAKQYPEVYRLAPANSLVYVKAADWSAEHFKNIAIIAENTDFGQGGAKVIADELEAKKVPHTLVTIDLNQQDFTPALLRLMSQDPKPDAIQMVIAGQAQYLALAVETLNPALAYLGLQSWKAEIPDYPVGISFFTFHAISYLVDIRRGDAQAFRNPLDLGLYLAFFPQLGVEADGGHAFYLGQELAKAEIAWRLGKRYVQDEALDFSLP